MVTDAVTGDRSLQRQGTRAASLYAGRPEVVAVYSNNELLSLNERLDISCSVRPLLRSDAPALQMVCDTLCTLVHMASTVAFPGLSLKHRYDVGGA